MLEQPGPTDGGYAYGHVYGSVQSGELDSRVVAGDARLSHTLRTEIKTLSDAARLAAEAEAKRAVLWGRVHLALGLPTAIVATVAGATSLISTTGRIAAGVLALCAAAMSAASSFLGSDTRASDAERRAAAFTTVAVDARVLATHGLDETDDGGLRRSLTSLVDRFEAIQVGDLASAEVLKAAERAR
ncbi:hypothetical protein LX16_2594 [Stackebrandtia albiflava]|uniref:SMODS and SLOG-associating 2TM effector domain-containing protein n=1 Tax=Stackebrandtia albiflava TaxID=406432 RepID=A0A562V224_9ACTN|nr:hypothetical protein [Stackebrandtia albiflava]TWJ11857.1 hypothetical protein LX16_2594 [Stackebrandtia albiflava]